MTGDGHSCLGAAMIDIPGGLAKVTSGLSGTHFVSVNLWIAVSINVEPATGVEPVTF